MQSLLPQRTEQWYAWVFLWGRFRKPSLEAARSFTISLMPAYNEYPCVRQFGRVCVCVCVNSCFCYTDSVLRLVSNSIMLNSRVCLLLCELVWSLGWHVSVCPDIVQQPVTASPPSLSLSLFFSLRLSGLFCCQRELVPVMDHSRTDTNLSWCSRNSIPPYWDQLHRMLSPIVPYSEYTVSFCLSCCMSPQTDPLELVGLCLNQWPPPPLPLSYTPEISRSGYCVV